jgi:hypothetical protein
MGFHFDETNRYVALRQLPRGFATGQTGADNGYRTFLHGRVVINGSFPGQKRVLLRIFTAFVIAIGRYAF